MADDDLPELPDDELSDDVGAGENDSQDGSDPTQKEPDFGDVDDAFEHNSEDADELDNDDDQFDVGARSLYLPFNNVFYAVPAAAENAPCVVRQYNYAHEVASGQVLGELRKGMCAGWLDVVKNMGFETVAVLVGRLSKDDPTLYPVWYALLTVADSLLLQIYVEIPACEGSSWTGLLADAPLRSAERAWKPRRRKASSSWEACFGFA